MDTICKVRIKCVYASRVDAILPVWAQPHRFWLLHARRRDVFTFGLVLTELRSLHDADGVRSLGDRFGFEWLPGLSDGVQRETGSKLLESDLEAFLRDLHGIRGPNHMTLEGYARDLPSAEPPDDVLRSFASVHGRLIRQWSLNAFDLLDIRLYEWARARQRIPAGYEGAAAKRLEATQAPHRLRAVNSLDGRRRWARTYTSLYERVAVELEDLVILRPKPRLCPLCSRAYIPLQPRQTVCGNQIWDAHSRKLVRGCTPTEETAVYDAAAAADYRRRRKTRWAAMNRALVKHGYGDPRTQTAIERWTVWKAANPPPRPPGRPPAFRDGHDQPPYAPDRR